MATISEQHEIIIDWIYEHGNEFFSIHDMDFVDYWLSKSGKSEAVLKRRINELVETGRLDRTRTYQERTRPSGIPKWFYVYS